MKPVCIPNIQAVASANVTPDGAINVQVMFTIPDLVAGDNAPARNVGSQGYYLQPDDAKAVAETPLSEAEAALGLPLMDLLVARSLVILYQRGHFALPQLIPAAMLPAPIAGVTQ